MYPLDFILYLKVLISLRALNLFGTAFYTDRPIQDKAFLSMFVGWNVFFDFKLLLSYLVFIFL